MVKRFDVSPAEAKKFLDLLAHRREWIHQRLETLELASDGSTRRTISLDLNVEEAFIGSSNMLPVSRMDKRTFKNLKVSSGAGELLSILTREQTTQVALEVLKLGLKAEYIDNSEEYLRQIIDYDFQGHDSEVQFNSAFKPAWGFLLIYFNRLDDSDPKLFDSLMEVALQLINGNFLIVQVPHTNIAGSRVIITISYDDPLEIRGLVRPKILKQPLLNTWSKTVQVEIHTSPQIVIKKLSIEDLDVNRNITSPLEDEQALDKSARQISKVALNENPPEKRFATSILLRAESRGLPSTALFALALTCLATIELFTTWLPKAFQPGYVNGVLVQGNTSTTTNVLLLAPSLLFAFIARGSVHNVEAKLLNFLRRALFVSALWMFMLAIVNVHSSDVRIWHIFTHSDLAITSCILFALYSFWFLGATNFDAKIVSWLNRLKYLYDALELKFVYGGIKPVYFAVYKNFVVSARGKRNKKYPEP